MYCNSSEDVVGEIDRPGWQSLNMENKKKNEF